MQGEDTLIAIFMVMLGYAVVHSAWVGKLTGRGRVAWMDRAEDPVAFWAFWGIGLLIYLVFVWNYLDTTIAVFRYWGLQLSAWLGRW